MIKRRELIGMGALAWASRFASAQDAASATGFVYDDVYLRHDLGPGHPESPERLRAILRELERTGLDRELTPLPLLESPEGAIRAFHEGRHVDAVSALPVTGEVARAAVGGVLSAVDEVGSGRVHNAFCAVRPPGHHANNQGREEGFCFYSNAAIAARRAQSLGYEKVLIIDWDYHHGNGTQNAFYEDPSVLFFSSHDWHAYPGTGDPSLTGAGDGSELNINVHLDCGARDRDMLAAWDRKLLPAVSSFEPDFIVISAGFDSRAEDLLGCFEITDDAFARMTRTTLDLARTFCEGRVVSLLEGGYNIEGLAKGVAAHVGELVSG